MLYRQGVAQELPKNCRLAELKVAQKPDTSPYCSPTGYLICEGFVYFFSDSLSANQRMQK